MRRDPLVRAGRNGPLDTFSVPARFRGRGSRKQLIALRSPVKWPLKMTARNDRCHPQLTASSRPPQIVISSTSIFSKQRKWISLGWLLTGNFKGGVFVHLKTCFFWSNLRKASLPKLDFKTSLRLRISGQSPLFRELYQYFLIYLFTFKFKKSPTHSRHFKIFLKRKLNIVKFARKE